jgi:heterodisulfide reductase subunit A
MNANNTHIAEAASRLLERGYDGVIGLKERWGHVGPFVFTRQEELKELTVEPRYPMALLARKLLEARNGRRLGVVARGCDVRAIKELIEAGRLKEDSIAFVGIQCSEEQAQECNCEKPIYSVTKCTGCWECVENCPEEAIEITSCCPIVLPNEFDIGLAFRRAIYTPYPQAVPRAYLRDAEHCLKLTDKMDCKGCTNICQAEAPINEEEVKEESLEVGAIVAVPGFEEFLSELKYDYGYSRYPDVVSSIQFERLLSASGPYRGHVQRLSDGKEPKRIAFLQCVGSRDISCRRGYCSSVCCMYAIKEAVIAKEHIGEVDVTVFFMDIRAFGKDFDKYYERAKSEYGVRFVRARVSDVYQKNGNTNLTVKYSPETAQLAEEEFDMVVLSVGLQPGKSFRSMASKLGVRLDQYGFIWTNPLNPLETSRAGILVGGAASGPKDIPETVTQASGAASEASELLAEVRNTLTQKKVFPPERDISEEEPRIGVFVCHCGINIGGVVNVPTATEYAKTLPNVVFAEDNLYTCSQDTQDHMKEMIKEHNLNRVVVASCSPRTHEPIFRETVREAGLNPYLFSMANIRDQCSWIHMKEPEEATEKAKDLVAMTVAKVSRLEPLVSIPMEVKSGAMVIGGGITGMSAALSLAEQGFEVNLVEREKELGGNLRHLYFLLDGNDPQEFLAETTRKVTSHPKIIVHTRANIESIEGFLGNFKTTIKSGAKSVQIEHGAVIVATGAEQSVPTEYLYGSDERVLTLHELEEHLAGNEFKAKSVVMIQCVGSREKGHMYCSRICCATAVKNALKIKELSPQTEVTVLYRDMRTYGLAEQYYQEARERGVLFVRYDVESKPVVTSRGRLKVKVKEPLLERELELSPDLLVLSARIDASEGNESLSKMLKIPINEDGFFLEAHSKLRPVDFATEGIYLAGMAHSPKTVAESIAQGKAAAARAATIISKDVYEAEATIAVVNEDICDGCGICVGVCEYNALEIVENPDNTKVVKLNEAMCKGCGCCVAACPSGAMEQKGFKNEQILAEIDAALAF